MSSLKIDFRCPKCRKKTRTKLYRDVDSSKIRNIYDRSLFSVTCPYCYDVSVLDYSIIVYGENYSVLYCVNEDKLEFSKEKEIKRIVKNYSDLKEKLLILEDKYNDILIEFIKEFLLNQLDKELVKYITDIRYDGSNEDSLIFYLVGINKSIGCKISFYEELLKQSEFKNIDSCIEVDKESYHNYFRLR